MPDYSKAKIYLIKNDIDDKVYVGSTVNPLKQRMQTHKAASRKYPNNKFYKHVIELGGWEHFKIMLHEKYPCECKKDLLRKEGQCIMSFKEQVLNYQIAGNTTFEFVKRSDTKYYQKRFIENKKKLVEYQKMISQGK